MNVLPAIKQKLYSNVTSNKINHKNTSPISSMIPNTPNKLKDNKHSEKKNHHLSEKTPIVVGKMDLSKIKKPNMKQNKIHNDRSIQMTYDQFNIVHDEFQTEDLS